MALTHTFVSAKADGADATLVRASNWNADHVPDANGIVMTAGTTDPATPAAGFINLYAKKIADRCMPKWVGPAGVDTPVQACLGMNRAMQMAPAGGTSSTTVVAMLGPNGGFTTGGTTFAQPSLASTRLQTALRRCTIATDSITAGTFAYLRCNKTECWRGNAAGLGGFFFVIRFGLEGALQTGMRVFAGLSDSIATPTNVDPTTSTTIGKVGLAINASTGNWNLVTNTAASVPTVTGLGASFPVNVTDVFELILFSAPNGSSIGYRVTNLSAAANTSGTLSTNLPANTSFLAPMYWGTNNATVAAVTLGFGKWYLESDA